MSNAKRIADKKPEKKAREPRVRRPKYDISNLPDAVVDGKMTVPVKGRLLFERTLDKRTAIHEGYVFSIDADGTVTVWDETRKQFYAFSANHPHPPVKAVRSAGDGST